ncbi:unnamed protein product [Vitrella brassicaformis CCMP3155]|uniref:Protein kinase domain-containing protein n=1 Tax=Vitrella brassicaformis (strain CCMP3155) TaxID=1169540 RepID=A0A0G4ER72_VITBC|nr:unnamed protein product [Vitrella brassicaformis CCMP3155]|eukprot:CEL99761.1 unnamed protein product [Vitrella brassicaformis CCMP3155]
MPQSGSAAIHLPPPMPAIPLPNHANAAPGRALVQVDPLSDVAGCREAQQAVRWDSSPFPIDLPPRLTAIYRLLHSAADELQTISGGVGGLDEFIEDHWLAALARAAWQASPRRDGQEILRGLLCCLSQLMSLQRFAADQCRQLGVPVVTQGKGIGRRFLWRRPYLKDGGPLQEELMEGMRDRGGRAPIVSDVHETTDLYSGRAVMFKTPCQEYTANRKPPSQFGVGEWDEGRWEEQKLLTVLNEARVLGHVRAAGRHQGIIGIRAVQICLDGNGVLFAEDGDVPSRVDRRQRLGIIRQLLEAVAFLHQNGVIYRDMKPHNIMYHRHGADCWAPTRPTK